MFLCFMFHIWFFCKVKLFVLLLCVCKLPAGKSCRRNYLYSVGRDVKPYSYTHSLFDEIVLSEKIMTY